MSVYCEFPFLQEEWTSVVTLVLLENKLTHVFYYLAQENARQAVGRRQLLLSLGQGVGESRCGCCSSRHPDAKWPPCFFRSIIL